MFISRIQDYINETTIDDEEQCSKYKYKAAQFLIWSLFEKCAPIPGNEEIIVTGHVFLDGKGDWFHMLNRHKYLKKKFPNRNVRLIVTADEVHRGKLINSKVKDLLLHYTESSKYIPYIKPDEIGQDYLSYVEKAAAVVFGPLETDGIYNDEVLDDFDFSTKWISMSEYDFRMEPFTDCGTIVGLGLKTPTRLGIFTRTPKEKYSFADIENEHLKKILIQTNLLYLCYMGKTSALQFFHQAAVFSEKLNPGIDIDICYPCKKDMENLTQALPTTNLASHGIATVTLIYFKETIQTEIEIRLAESGKKMRIIDPGLLSSRDFRLLTYLSGPIVGCTGDNSLSLALSYGKIPVYEVCDHKQKLSNHLLEIILKKFGSRSPLYKYMESTLSERIPSSKLATPLLIKQGKALGAHIREFYSANGVIQGIVNECILRHKDPEFRIWEDKILADYCNDRISLQKVESLVTQQLQDRHLQQPG